MWTFTESKGHLAFTTKDDGSMQEVSLFHLFKPFQSIDFDTYNDAMNGCKMYKESLQWDESNVTKKHIASINVEELYL